MSPCKYGSRVRVPSGFRNNVVHKYSYLVKLAIIIMLEYLKCDIEKDIRLFIYNLFSMHCI